jgi:serine/threonine-protein kinase
LAKIVDQSRHLTQTGEFFGTPNTMPPEQIAGDRRKVGPLADVYSLGATLYVSLTGEAPFSGQHLAQLLNAVLFKAPAPPSARRPGLSPALERICLRCLEKRQEERYPSMEALAADLRAFLAGEEVSPARVAWRRVPLGVLAALLLCGVLGSLGWALREPAAPRPPRLPGSPSAPEAPVSEVPPSPEEVEGNQLPEGVEALGGEEFLHPKTRMVLVYVPPGSFQMGREQEESEREELTLTHPVHSVQLTRGFFLGKLEVTRRQYRRYCAEAGLSEPARWTAMPGSLQPPEDGDHPAEVSWEEASAYCAWAGLRLPTEAEWAFAARGPHSYPYPWGDPLPDGERANAEVGTRDRILPVGQFPLGASPFGCLDMVGNLQEWVQDYYDEYDGVAQVDPTGPDTGREWGQRERGLLRVARGGSFRALQAYAAQRVGIAERLALRTGFRAAISAPGAPPARPR